MTGTACAKNDLWTDLWTNIWTDIWACRWIAFLVVAPLLAVAPTHAVILCSGPCPSFPGPPPVGEITPNTDVPILSEVGITALVAEGEDFDLAWGGALRIEVPRAGSVLDRLEVAALDTLIWDLPLGVLTVGMLSLCTDTAFPDCIPDDAMPAGSGTLGVRLPQRGGTIRLTALGDVTVTTAPTTAAEPAALSLAVWVCMGPALRARRVIKSGVCP